MEYSASAITKLREEFTAHTASKNGLRFQSSLVASTGISTMTRDLETKRQLENLTVEEKAALSEIDALWQKISRFNNQMASAKTAPARDQIYSIKDSKFVPEPQLPKAEPHPMITTEFAEEIISGLNKQFEDKIMPERAGVESGRNLQEYLSHIQSQKPRLPFANEESHIDLDKLKQSA